MKKNLCLFIAMVLAIATTRGEGNLVGLSLGAFQPTELREWTPTELQEWTPAELQASTLTFAQDKPLAPSIPTGKPMTFWQRRNVQVGFGLLGVGAIAASADLQTRQLRQDYIPTFRMHHDDFLQFAPLAITVGLKACGVESRSSWERLALSSALGVGSTLAVVYAGKFGIGRLRPDNTRHNSFPSGHTAMAFSSATILNREYGHLSPWVSVVSYSAATITGISRMLNNRHWLTDVIVGASVGILGTELGYLLADKWLGNRGLIRPQDDEWKPVHIGRNPSYVGVALGGNMLLWDRKRYDKVAPSGVGFNVEGAWFFTPHLGVGGQAKVGRYADLMEKGALGEGHITDPKPLNSLAVQGGLFYNLPLDSDERWHLGAKTLAGVAKNHYQKNEVVDNDGTLIGHLEHSPIEHLTATLGLSLRYVAADNLGVRLFADYNWMRTGATYTPTTGSPKNFAAYRTPLSVGIAFDAMLW